MEIVIIGGSFAGLSTALTAKRLYPEAVVRVFESQQSVGFIPSGLNLKLNDEIKTIEDATFISEQEIRLADIQLHLNTEVTEVDFETKTIRFHSTFDQQTDTVRYDKLVLAMGSKQTSTLIPSDVTANVITTKQLHDATHSLALLEDAFHVAVIGAGQIGLEATEALVNANKIVSIVDQQDTLAPRYFDEEFVEDVKKGMAMAGVNLYLGQKVNAIEFEDGMITVETESEYLYPDAILMGTNLIPNSALVQGKLPLNEDQTVKVNQYLETEIPDVFAVGDLVQVPYANTDSMQFIAIVNNAVRSGQVAAFNLFERKIPQAKSVRLIGSRVFSQYLVSVGMTEKEAIQANRDIQTTQVTGDYSLTDDTPVYLKLVVDKASGQILGAQVKSEGNILSFADPLGLAVSTKLTDYELAVQDRLYYPRETATYPIIYQAGLVCFESRDKLSRA